MWDSLEVFYRVRFISAFNCDCFDVCVIWTEIFKFFSNIIQQNFMVHGNIICISW